MNSEFEKMVCPECGSPFEREVFVGISGRTLGPRFICGSIYYPAIGEITARGQACNIIRKLKEELHDRANRGLVLAECYIDLCCEDGNEARRFRDNNDNYMALCDYKRKDC